MLRQAVEDQVQQEVHGARPCLRLPPAVGRAWGWEVSVPRPRGDSLSRELTCLLRTLRHEDLCVHIACVRTDTAAETCTQPGCALAQGQGDGHVPTVGYHGDGPATTAHGGRLGPRG